MKTWLKTFLSFETYFQICVRLTTAARQVELHRSSLQHLTPAAPGGSPGAPRHFGKLNPYSLLGLPWGFLPAGIWQQKCCQKFYHFNFYHINANNLKVYQYSYSDKSIMRCTFLVCSCLLLMSYVLHTPLSIKGDVVWLTYRYQWAFKIC